MKNRKAETSLGGKTVGVILVALVILSVLVFLFTVDIQKWLNFLPSFGTQEDTEYVDKCPVKIAEIKDGMILFCNQETKICDITSKLQIDGEKIQVHNTNIIIPDTDIGQITVNIIIIFDEVIKKEGKLYSSVVNDLPDYSDLINLYGAYLHSKTEICRNEPVKEEITYTPKEKIGALKYESGKDKIYYYAIAENYNVETKQWGKASIEEDSNLFIKDYFIYVYRPWFKSFKVGVRDPQTNMIGIYSQYLSDESWGVNPSDYLNELNNAEIVRGEIYKKNEVAK